MVKVCNSGAVWTGAGGLTLSRSWGPFRTAYLRFIIIELLYSLHSVMCVLHAWTTASFFAGSEHSMHNDAQSSIADIIYSSQTEQAGCDEWQIRIKMKQSVNAMSLKDVKLSFLFLYYAYPIILNDSPCWMYLFFSAALFTVLTARC